MTDDALPRRKFLLGAGLAGTAIATGIPGQAEAQPAPPTPAAVAPPATDTEPFVTLTATEAAFIVAAVDTLIPADEFSPSGSDCGVAVFIDRQLGSAWGGGAKMYRAGPFHKGKPEQGYQLSLTPREFFAAVQAMKKPAQLIVGEAYNHFELLETLANPYGLTGRALLRQMQIG